VNPFQLLDETSDPPLRTVIGRLLQRAESADIAVGRIRLASLDLTAQEIEGPSRCRVLVGRLDASTLLDTGRGRDEALARLARWTRTGRLHVRSAGIGAWRPDFSVYRTAHQGTALLGAHYFGSPQLTVGPSFTVVARDPAIRYALTRRFDQLWDRSHDVLPAISQVLDRARVGAASGS
jgi:hypothetical protein